MLGRSVVLCWVNGLCDWEAISVCSRERKFELKKLREGENQDSYLGRTWRTCPCPTSFWGEKKRKKEILLVERLEKTLVFDLWSTFCRHSLTLYNFILVLVDVSADFHHWNSSNQLSQCQQQQWQVKDRQRRRVEAHFIPALGQTIAKKQSVTSLHGTIAKTASQSIVTTWHISEWGR